MGKKRKRKDRSDRCLPEADRLIAKWGTQETEEAGQDDYKAYRRKGVLRRV